MCEPATLTAIGTWLAGSGTAAAGTAAAASTAAAAGTAAAGTAAAGLTTAQMITLGLSAASAGIAGISMYQQSRTAKAVAGANARNAEMQARDALQRGEKEAMEVRRRAAAAQSAQRVGLAGHGLDVSFGTAADIQDQTDFFGQADAATARNNARREAFARQSQSANFQAEAAAYRPWLAGGSTLLSGASQVADKWYSYGRKG